MILPHDILDDCFELTGTVGTEREENYGAGGPLTEGSAWWRRGATSRRMRGFEGIASMSEAASTLAPFESLRRCMLAERQAEAGCIETAIHLFREVAEDSRCPTALLPDVASGLGGLGDYNAALAACREILRREPAHHQAHFGAAFYLRRLGASPHAILPDVIQAHELAPEIPLYRITLAVLFEAIGWREDAYDMLRDVDPSTVPCRCCLQKAMAIFRDAGDVRRFESFRARTQSAPGTRHTDG